MPTKWLVLSGSVAALAMALAFLARSQGVAWFLLFWVVAMAWVVIAWVVILPRWQKAQPLARKFASLPTRASDIRSASLWQSVGAIRLPSELGGLNASWPLARLLAYDDGVRLEPTLKWMSFLPSLSVEWAALERIESVGRRGIRLRIKDPAAALLIFALANRDGFLEIAEQRGAAVDRSHRRHPWLSVG